MVYLTIMKNEKRNKCFMKQFNIENFLSCMLLATEGDFQQSPSETGENYRSVIYKLVL